MGLGYFAGKVAFSRGNARPRRSPYWSTGEDDGDEGGVRVHGCCHRDACPPARRSDELRRTQSNPILLFVHWEPGSRQTDSTNFFVDGPLRGPAGGQVGAVGQRVVFGGISKDEFRSLCGPSGPEATGKHGHDGKAATAEAEAEGELIHGGFGNGAGPHPIRPQSGVWRGLAERGEGRVRPLRAPGLRGAPGEGGGGEKAERFGTAERAEDGVAGPARAPAGRPPRGLVWGGSLPAPGTPSGPAGAREGGGAPRSSRPHEGRAHDVAHGVAQGRGSGQVKAGDDDTFGVP